MKLDRIFISKQAGIGDVVLLTPVLSSLKKRFPNTKLTLMTFNSAIDAVDGLSFIDEVFSYDKKQDSVLKVIKKMRGHDLALFFDLQYRIPLLAFLAGIPIRAGLTHKRNFWLTHNVDWQEYMDHFYEPYVFADILKKAIGIEISYEELDRLFFAEPTSDEYSLVESFLKNSGYSLKKPFLACSPVTAYYLKDWPLENWRRLFEKIYEQFQLPIILFGKKIEIFDNIPGVINLGGKTNLRQAACIVKHAKLLINSCSLPVHMAAAFNVPSVVLYGYGDPKRWAPRHKCAVISANLPCSPCDGYIGTTCTDPKCMRLISVESVFEAVEKSLK